MNETPLDMQALGFDMERIEAWLSRCGALLFRTEPATLETRALCPYARLLGLFGLWIEGRQPEGFSETEFSRKARATLQELRHRSQADSASRLGYALSVATRELLAVADPVKTATAEPDGPETFCRLITAPLTPQEHAALCYECYLRFGEADALRESRRASAPLFARLKAGGCGNEDATVDLLYTLLPLYRYESDDRLPRADDVVSRCFVPPEEATGEPATRFRKLFLVFSYWEQLSTDNYQAALFDIGKATSCMPASAAPPFPELLRQMS